MAPMETNEDSLQPKEIQNAQSSHAADQSHGPKHGQYLHLPPHRLVRLSQLLQLHALQSVLGVL